jgi:excisionase family DNA binding protein
MSNHLLKAKEVAEKLNISRSQAFALMRNEQIPVVRFGRCVRVRPEDLEEFIRKNSISQQKTNLLFEQQVSLNK